VDYQWLDDSFLPTRKDLGVSWLEMTWKTVCFRPYVSGGQCSCEPGGFARRLIDLGSNAPIEKGSSRLANSQAFA
jgi:hypothetical protein